MAGLDRDWSGFALPPTCHRCGKTYEILSGASWSHECRHQEIRRDELLDRLDALMARVEQIVERFA